MTSSATPRPRPTAGPGPGADAPPRQEWWERLRDRTSRSRIFLALRRVRAVATWFALLVLVVAVMVSPTLRTALGAWIGCLWLVVCWFALARAKTVSWALTSGVLATGMPLALLIAMVSLWVCSVAGVTPSDTAASIVVASVVEEVLKLTPLAILALAAPGRVRRLLVSDWIVLGAAAGAAFETVEEVTRRIALLTGSGSLLDSLLCPKGGARQVECNGATTYSLNPFSGVAGNVFPYAGHAVVTGLVAGAIGLGIALWRRGRVHRGGYRAVLQVLALLVPLWTWWVAVVDHMGRNASNYVMWLQTGGEAPSWPIGATASLTGHGHGRGVILLLMLALAWVIDSRTLWSGGYVSFVESSNYGNRWAPWRWRVWAGVPRNTFGRFLADGACLVSVVGVEWRWAWMTLMEAAAFREPRLLLTTPAKLRIAREEAARTELDPEPEQWWRVRLAGLCAVVTGVLVIALVPGFTQSMADSLGEGSAHWLAGLLDALGAAWESLSWEQKLGLMLFAGAMILLVRGHARSGLRGRHGRGHRARLRPRGSGPHARPPGHGDPIPVHPHTSRDRPGPGHRRPDHGRRRSRQRHGRPGRPRSLRRHPRGRVRRLPVAHRPSRMAPIRPKRTQARMRRNRRNQHLHVEPTQRPSRILGRPEESTTMVQQSPHTNKPTNHTCIPVPTQSARNRRGTPYFIRCWR